jgi:hypothetical protein
MAQHMDKSSKVCASRAVGFASGKKGGLRTSDASGMEVFRAGESELSMRGRGCLLFVQITVVERLRCPQACQQLLGHPFSLTGNLHDVVNQGVCGAAAMRLQH